MRETIEEIKAAYPREWVLLVDYEDDESGRLAAGRLVAHSPHRGDIYARPAGLTGQRNCAVRFTGPVPDDLVFVS